MFQSRVKLLPQTALHALPRSNVNDNHQKPRRCYQTRIAEHKSQGPRSCLGAGGALQTPAKAPPRSVTTGMQKLSKQFWKFTLEAIRETGESLAY